MLTFGHMRRCRFGQSKCGQFHPQATSVQMSPNAGATLFFQSLLNLGQKARSSPPVEFILGKKCHDVHIWSISSASISCPKFWAQSSFCPNLVNWRWKPLWSQFGQSHGRLLPRVLQPFLQTNTFFLSLFIAPHLVQDSSVLPRHVVARGGTAVQI